jgi:hypothetical protein
MANPGELSPILRTLLPLSVVPAVMFACSSEAPTGSGGSATGGAGGALDSSAGGNAGVGGNIDSGQPGPDVEAGCAGSGGWYGPPPCTTDDDCQDAGPGWKCVDKCPYQMCVPPEDGG